jgi:uncharacterized protein (TIRG00374 family)
VSGRSWVRLSVGLLITAFFVWLVARQVDGGQLLAALAGADLRWVTLALLGLMLGFACRISRWHLMLQQDNPQLRWRQCSGPLLASFAINNLLPLRAGDVVRAVGFSRRLGSGPGAVTATLFVERLLDLMMLLCALGLALAVFKLSAGQLSRIGGAGLLLLSGLILVLLLVPRISMFSMAALLWGAGRLAPGLVARVKPEVERGLRNLQALAQGSVMGRLVLWSVAAWAAEGLMFWMAAQALAGVTIKAGAWLAFPVATLSTLVPSSPGYVGTFDYFASLAMRLMGNPAAPAAAFAILVHLLLWLPITVVGLVCLLLARPDRLVFGKLSR